MKKWLKRALTMLACLVVGASMSAGFAACNKDGDSIVSEQQSEQQSEQSSEQSSEESGSQGGEEVDGHVHAYEETIVPATCTATGTKTLTCACGDVQTETIEKLSHVWVSKAEDTYVVTAATCIAPATYAKSCESCGEKGTETFTSGELGAHTWAESQDEAYLVAAANCDRAAIYEKYCSTCKTARGEQYSVGKALGHDYVKTTIEPTCFVDGFDSYTCQRSGCGHTYADLGSVVKAPGEHTHTPVVTPPTCTTQGYTTYTCTCGDSYVADYTAVEHDYEVTTIPSTCMAMGYDLHACECGESYKDNYQPVAAHSTPVETIVKEASCTEEGLKTITYTCECQAEYNEPIEKLAHVYVAGTPVAPTCLEKGYTVYACECGDSYIKDYTDATGHNYVAGAPVAPTCVDKGYTEYTCACNDSYRVETAALGHVAGEWKLLKDGNGEEILTHIEGCEYERTYQTKCETCLCDMEKKENLTKHNYIVSIAQVATCQGPGTKAFTCVCGANYSEAYSLAEGEDGHQWSTASVKSGVETIWCQVKNCGASKTTIVAEGSDAKVSKEALQSTGEVQMETALIQMDEKTKNQLTAGEGDLDLHASTLKEEDKTDLMSKLSDSQKEKLADKPVYNFTVNNGATTEFDGEMTITVPYTLAAGEDAEGIVVWYIDDNGEIAPIEAVYTEINGVGYAVFKTNHFSKYTVVRLTPSERCAIYGHNEKTREVLPTCETDGYLLTYCIRCGYNETAEVYKATGHNYTGEITEATCTTQGYTTYVCGNGCGKFYRDNYVEALGHNYKEEVYEATCTEAGRVEYTCERCNHNYQTTTEEALGHDWNIKDNKPTCKENGSTVYHCKRCNYNYKVVHSPKADHEYKETEKKATCYSKGYTEYMCEFCQAIYKDKFTDMAEHHYVTTVVDPTCTAKGYTLHACDNEGCTDSYKDNYKSETGHKYGADFLCEVCGAEHPAVNHGAKGFYVTLRESLMMADNYFVTVENFTYTSTTKFEGTLSDKENYQVNVLDFTFGFDEDGYIVGHGRFEMPVEMFDYNKEGEVTDSTLETYLMQVIFKNGKAYVFTGEMAGDASTYECYVLLSQKYMFDEVGFPVTALRTYYLDLYSDNARKVIATAMGITDKEINNAIGALVEYMFVKSETGDGYTFTFNAQQAYVVIEKLATRSVKELVETIFGAGQYDKIFEKVNEALNGTIGDFESKIEKRLTAAGYKLDDLYSLLNTGIGMIFAEASHIDEFDLREFVNEYRDEVVAELLADEMGISVENLKSMVQDVQDMCETRSLVSVIFEMSGEAEDEAEAEEYIDYMLETLKEYLPYFGETNITLTTDRNGKASALSVKLDVQVESKMMNEKDGVYTTTIVVKGNGTIKLNDSFELTFGDLIDKVEDYIGDVKLEVGSVIKGYEGGMDYVVYGKDGAIIVTQNIESFNSIQKYGEKVLLGTEVINGIEYNKYSVYLYGGYASEMLPGGIYQEKYVEFEAYYYDAESGGIVVDDYCGDWTSYGLLSRRGAVYYTVWALEDGTVANFELDWDATVGAMHYTDTFYFWYNAKTGEMKRESAHNYEIVDSYETDVCGEYCWYIHECTGCGDSYKSKMSVSHNMQYRTELVEGATSCADGWYRVYECTKCDYVEKERYKESYHNATHNIVVVETPCGEARIEYYACACGYEHNTNLNFYEEDDCQFEAFYEETQFDEEGYPIPQDMMYKCQTCGTVITIKSSGNNYGEKYSAYGLSYKEPIYDYNDPNYNSGSNVVIGKPDYEYSEYPDYSSEYPGYDKPGYEEGDKPGYDVSCYVEGFFQIYVNGVLVVDKQYKVAQHGDTERRESWEGEYRIEETVCYYCGTTLRYTKYDQNDNVVYTVNEKGMGYRVEQEGCKRITYYFNAQGDYDSMTEERHGNYYYVMELRKEGTTCMDGLKISTYCGGCDELQYTENYRPEGHPVEQAMPQYMEIATACGTVTLEYVVCPCGAQGAIYDLDPGACEMEMTGDDTTQAMTCTKCGFKAEMTREMSQEGCIMKGTMISTVSYGGNVFFYGEYTMEQESHNTEYVTSTDENGNRVEAYMCTGCGMVEESTTYDEYDRIIRRVYSDGSGREYFYDGCKVSERYFDSNGETYGGAGYENHTWGYTFEFLTASKNCNDGVRWIYKCTVCGEERDSHVDYGHNSFRDKDAFYTVQAGCGTMYVRGENCPCNYAGIMWHGIWVETSCGVDTQEEWLEDTKTEFERCIITYTCWNCGYIYTEYRYTSIASCKVTYHLVYSFGENGCDGTFEISYTEERHEQIRREEGATDDGKYLWEYYCEACGTWMEHHEYKRDQYGRTVWFMDRIAGTGWEIVYGDNCKYTKYTLNQAGERIDSVEGTQHGKFVQHYELADGAVTCEDGVICTYQCSACGYVEDQWTSYSHNTFLHTLEINTHCGRTYFDYYECACGMVVRTDMRVYGACDTTWFNGTSLDSYYEHNIHEYVCYITDCGFSYSVESYYYYENADSCLATYVLIYKLYNNGELIISKTGTDQSTNHRWTYQHTNYADGGWMEEEFCEACGIKIIRKYDKYGRQIYYWNDQEGYGWKREFTLCDYVEYRFYRDGRRYEDGWGTEHVWVYDRYIQEACTQYGTRISYCKCCGEDDLYEYVRPSHGYEWNEEKQTYVCWRCGLENDKGVDGDFVVEDLTHQYGGYTAGFFNGLGDRWEMEDGYNFYIVLNYDENAIGTAGKNVVVDVSYDLLEYGYEETGAAGSGIITLDMDELNAAITKAYGENWSGFENVSIVFQVFDKDFETGQFSYVDYVLTFSRI